MKLRVLLLSLLWVGGVAAEHGDGPPLPGDSLPKDLFDRSPPPGFDVPDRGDDERTRARFDLGRRLFFDPLLSVDETVSCASCHQPEHGFTAPGSLPLGVKGRRALRNAPTLFNRALGKRQSWDGRAASLREQVVMPISNPLEMDLALADAVRRLNEHDQYPRLFDAAFDDEVSEANLALALEEFVARIYLADSPVDRFHAGEFGTLGDDARHGMWVFDSKGKCWRCHSGPNFSDEGFHNTGVGVQNGKPEAGRADVTGKPEDRGAFKTPTLRGLTLTAPYMHDGSLATLEEVVAFYNRGGNANSHRDEKIEPLGLSEREMRSLVAFLKALSEDGAPPATPSGSSTESF